MISDRDPTPEQRRKLFRNQRLTAISYLISGVVWLGIGAFELWSGRRTWFTYFGLVFGPLALFLSWAIWKRRAEVRY